MLSSAAIETKQRVTKLQAGIVLRTSGSVDGSITTVDGRGLSSPGQGKRNELEVFVGLARARDGAAVVETEAIGLIHAAEQRREVAEVQQCLLRLEGAGHDQQMLVKDVELIQHAEMIRGHLAHHEIGIRREETG